MLCDLDLVPDVPINDVADHSLDQVRGRSPRERKCPCSGPPRERSRRSRDWKRTVSSMTWTTGMSASFIRLRWKAAFSGLRGLMLFLRLGPPEINGLEPVRGNAPPLFQFLKTQDPDLMGDERGPRREPSSVLDVGHKAIPEDGQTAPVEINDSGAREGGRRDRREHTRLGE